MAKSRGFKNSIFSVLETVIKAFVALSLFKLMVAFLGLKISGLWSFLASITAITGFGSSGFANALLFYIPKYKLEESQKRLNNLINTTFLSVFFLTLLLCVISYIIFRLIIPGIVDQSMVEPAFTILPLIVLSFLFYGLASSYFFILDGLMLMHIRAKINIAGSLLFLISGFYLLLKMGIAGIAVAQLIRNIFLLAISYFYVKKNILTYSFKILFDKQIFKSTFSFGFNFQIISITQIISEPFMKSMITKFAGTEITAIFDFSIKLLNVFRNLMIAANQTIVPQLTIFKVKGHIQRLKIYYRANFSLILFTGIILFLSPIVFMNSISILFLNVVSENFNFIFINVAISFLFNSLALPAYFQNIGTGKLKWNIINNIIAALIILTATPLLGNFFGGKYLILSWTSASVIASLFLIIVFNRENDIHFFRIFNSNNLLVFAAVLLSFICSRYLILITGISHSIFAITTMNLIILFVFLFYPIRYSMVFNKMLRHIRIISTKREKDKL